MKFLLLQSLRLACASHLPLHKGGLLPPDSIKGVRTNCPYSFCCRAGVYLPPFSLHISFVFGGSKPPPYKVAVGKTCFMVGVPYGRSSFMPYGAQDSPNLWNFYGAFHFSNRAKWKSKWKSPYWNSNCNLICCNEPK